MTRNPDFADIGPAIHLARPEQLVKPPWAGYIWSDDHDIWIELPCPVGKAPVIVCYPITEGGLAKALSLIRQSANIKRDPPPPGYFRHGEAKPKKAKLPTASLATQPDLLKLAVKAAMRKVGLT